MSAFSASEKISGSLAPSSRHWLLASLQDMVPGRRNAHAQSPFDLWYSEVVHWATINRKEKLFAVQRSPSIFRVANSPMFGVVVAVVVSVVEVVVVAVVVV